MNQVTLDSVFNLCDANFAGNRPMPPLNQVIGDLIRAGMTNPPHTHQDLVTAAAMWRVGPKGAGPPPNSIVVGLEGLIGGLAPWYKGFVNQIEDCTIAYGCGAGRAVNAGGPPWEDIWPDAVVQLAKRMMPAVKECNLWLKTFPGFPKRQKDALKSDARLLAMMLINPTGKPFAKTPITISCLPDETSITDGTKTIVIPAGARHVLEVTAGATITVPGRAPRTLHPGTKVVVLARDDQTWITAAGIPRITLANGQAATLDVPPQNLVSFQCGCGRVQCSTEHRISGWSPAMGITLNAFLATAVKGPNRPLKTGSFVQGMYFSMLSKEGF